MPHDASPAPTAPPRRALRSRRAWLLAGVALLYLASVPWYRAADGGLELWLGLPSWVTVAVLCYAGAAVLNALAWLVTAVDDDGALPRGLAERDGREHAEREGREHAEREGRERAERDGRERARPRSEG